MTLSRLRAESANEVPCGRMYPLLRTTVAAPSESLDCLDRVERVEPVELGVETERSSSGTASRAIEGDTLGEGESGRSSGEAIPLSVPLWLVVGLDETSTASAMFAHA